MPDDAAKEPPSSPIVPSDDEEVPVSSSRPAVPHVEDAPPGDLPANDDPDARVPQPVLEAFLALDSTQDIILGVVMRRLSKDPPEFLIDDLVSDANFACLTSKSGARDEAKLGSWVAGVSANAVKDYFRTNMRHAKHFNHEEDVDALAVEPLPEPLDTTTAEWLLERWLDKRVAGNARDRETLDLIRFKARTGKTDEEVCADKQLRLAQFRSRVHYFKKKHLAARQRHVARVEERNRLLVLWMKRVAAGIVAAVVIGFVFWLLWRPKLHAEPDRFQAPSLPTPSASASAPPPFNQALPPPGEPDKPKPQP
jgi:DNA-directed RNA polymerase specialized sigma24 family protein